MQTKRRRRCKKFRLPILVICIGVIICSGEARAEEVTRMSDAQVTVTWDPFVEATPEIVDESEEKAAAKNAVLPGTYESDGDTYYLKSYQMISTMTREKTQMAEDSVVYEAVEQADALPDQIEVEVTDEDSGLTVTEKVPVADTRFYNWRWIAGFEFPVIVQQYDAGQFYLGDIIVTEKPGDPFGGYERELLDLIGVNPYFYSIEMTEWVSEPWIGEDGLVYRQARASGQKYVADCEVTYKGTVTLPAVPAYAWEAVYSRKDDGSDVLLWTEDGKAQEDPGNQDQTRSDVLWTEHIRQVTRVVVGFLFVLGLFAGLWYLLKKREDKNKKKRNG